MGVAEAARTERQAAVYTQAHQEREHSKHAPMFLNRQLARARTPPQFGEGRQGGGKGHSAGFLFLFDVSRTPDERLNVSVFMQVPFPCVRFGIACVASQRIAASWQAVLSNLSPGLRVAWKSTNEGAWPSCYQQSVYLLDRSWAWKATQPRRQSDNARNIIALRKHAASLARMSEICALNAFCDASAASIFDSARASPSASSAALWK